MTDRQRAIEAADREFALYIKYRDGGRCFTCHIKGEPLDMDCGHFITRGKLGTRWDEDNAHAQCRACNDLHERDTAPYELSMNKKYGEGKVEELILKSNTVKKFSVYEIREIAKVYRDKRSRLN